MEYMAANLGWSSLKLAKALGRLVERGGPFVQPKRADGTLDPQSGGDVEVESQFISVTEIVREATTHDAEIEVFDEGLARLVSRANAKDESAVVLIHRQAARCIGALRGILQTSPEVVSRVASRSKTWPVMRSADRDCDPLIVSELQFLGVGTKTDSPFDLFVLEKKAIVRAKRGSKEDEMGDGEESENYQDLLDDVVIAAVEWIEWSRKTIRILRRREFVESLDESPLPRRNWQTEFSNRLPPGLSWKILDSLPDLDKSEDSFSAWYAVLRIYIVYRYGPTPETHPDFKKLAACGSNKKEVKSLPANRKPTAQRNVIWNRLRDTLKTLAKPVDVVPKPKRKTKTAGN